jgi:hypothetical protein
MPTVKEREKTDLATKLYDASGAQVKTREKVLVTPQSVATTITLSLHNGPVTFAMKVEIDPNTYPHVITGGTIVSGICGAPWDITGGRLGDDIRIDAKRTGSGSCASTIAVVGEFQHPATYRGTYGFDGSATTFRHSTIYHG